MSEFYISDYIWYIVGGVALFFVIVGFVADKSGLAKKTFSKDSKKTNDDAIQSQANVIVQDNTEEEPIVGESEMMENDQEVSIEASDYENNQVDTLEEDMVIENSPLYIADEQQSDSNDFLSVGPEFEDTETDSSGEIETSLTDDMVTPEDSSNVWASDDDENISTSIDFDNADASFTLDNDGDDTNISQDDAEVEWGMDSVDENDVVSSIDNELPNLDEIMENTEDDVWKF